MSVLTKDIPLICTGIAPHLPYNYIVYEAVDPEADYCYIPFADFDAAVSLTVITAAGDEFFVDDKITRVTDDGARSFCNNIVFMYNTDTLNLYFMKFLNNAGARACLCTNEGCDCQSRPCDCPNTTGMCATHTPIYGVPKVLRIRVPL